MSAQADPTFGSVPPPREENLVALNPFDDPPASSARKFVPSSVHEPPRYGGPGGPGMGGPFPGPGGGYYTRPMGPGHPAHPGGGPPYGAGPPQPFPPGAYPQMYMARCQSTIPSTNAPPIHPCGNCRHEIRDEQEAIQCSVPGGCSFFFHRDCAKLSKEAWQMLKDESYAEWVCNECYLKKKIDLIQTCS